MRGCRRSNGGPLQPPWTICRDLIEDRVERFEDLPCLALNSARYFVDDVTLEVLVALALPEFISERHH